MDDKLNNILNEIYDVKLNGISFSEAKQAITALIDLRCLEARIGELKRAKLLSFIPATHVHKVNRRINQLERELTQATDSASSGGGTSEHQSVPIASQETEKPHE